MLQMLGLDGIGIIWLASQTVVALIVVSTLPRRSGMRVRELATALFKGMHSNPGHAGMAD